MHLGMTPREAEAKHQRLKQKGKMTLTFFLLSVCLPFLIYALFYFNIFESRPRYAKRLEIPVARLVAQSTTGSAFLVSDRYLLTARHVVEKLDPGATVELTFEKANPPITTSGHVIWKDNAQLPPPEVFLHDIALIELDNPGQLPEGFPHLQPGDSDGIGTRESVILIGFPGGLMTTTAGRIANDQVQGLEIFQLDVNAWEGSSGGPLIDEKSEEVVGILVAGLADEFRGINFAVKINFLRAQLELNGFSLQ